MRVKRVVCWGSTWRVYVSALVCAWRLRCSRMLKGCFWLAGHLVPHILFHGFLWLWSQFWYQETSMIYLFIDISILQKSDLQKSEVPWVHRGCWTFFVLSAADAQILQRVLQARLGGAGSLQKTSIVTHVTHVKVNKILGNFVEICLRLSPRLQICGPYAATTIHFQKQSRRLHIEATDYFDECQLTVLVQISNCRQNELAQKLSFGKLPNCGAFNLDGKTLGILRNTLIFWMSFLLKASRIIESGSIASLFTVPKVVRLELDRTLMMERSDTHVRHALRTNHPVVSFSGNVWGSLQNAGWTISQGPTLLFCCP